MANIIRAGTAEENSEPVQLPLRPGISSERSEEGERKRIALRMRISQQATERTKQARLDREQIIEAAKQEAASILQQARETAVAIVGGARNEQARIEEHARANGVNAAKEFARKEALAAVDRILRIFEKAEQDLRAMKDAYLRSAANGILDITTVILERLIRGRIEIDRDLVKRTIDEAVGEISAVDRITLRVHPDDLSAATEYEADIMNMVDNLSDVSVTADPAISPGGVLIETSFGRVDARLETQLSEILREVRVKVAQHSPQDSAAPEKESES